MPLGQDLRMAEGRSGPGQVLQSFDLGGGTAASQSSRMTRDQWTHFLDTYKPVEDDLIASAMNTDFTSQGDTAGATARQSVASAAGTAERNLSRAGATLTTEERAAVSRRRDLSKAKATAGAENSTRRVLSDTRTNLLAGLVNIGRGVANTAQSGMQSAADMEAQREAQYQSQKSATKQSNLSTAASAAALLIAFV